MPIYEYRCPECGAEFEKMQKMSAAPPPCPECGHDDVVKKVSASAFVLKGSGWYKDHYGLKKSSSTSSEAGGSTKAESAQSAPEKASPPSTPTTSSTE